MMKESPPSNFGYNRRLKNFARHMRKKGTKAEASLWKYGLRAGKMRGYRFRRQRPVFNYIADFMCKELKLIVEVDGITHQDEEQIARDRQKNLDLNDAGFSVLRFTDEMVLNRIDLVLIEIDSWIQRNEEDSGI
jgi:very-short-patch-repair endonuclease